LNAYLEQFISDHHNLFEESILGVMAGLTDLAGHKNPRLRVLRVGRECDCKTRQLLNVLDNKSDFPRSQEWHIGNFSNGELVTSSVSNSEKLNNIKLDADKISTYDVVLMPQVSPKMLQ